MKKIAITCLATAALLSGALVGAVSFQRGVPASAVAMIAQPVWTEVPWPFPMDQWGQGKAFRCKPADCSTEVNVYVRAKIGFCNCATGVSDDEELERISDFDLFGHRPTALAPGRPISIAWMSGRSRGFILGNAPVAKSALSVGFNDRCDAIIATAVVGHERPEALEPAVLELLNSKIVLRWAEVTLGL
jgi:hypothetical protein